MRVTIEKKTDQLNYEDFLGGVTMTVTIAGVKKGTKEQPYDIAIEGDRRAWRPAATVLKILVAAWGDDATAWTGRRATLYGDPDVTFGRDRVGGIRVSHLSHINEPLTLSLTETRGKRKVWKIDPLPDPPAPTGPTVDDVAACTDEQTLRDMWKHTTDTAIHDAIRARVEQLRTTPEDIPDEQFAAIAAPDVE